MLWIIGNQLSEINRRGSPAGSALEYMVAGGGSEAGLYCRVLQACAVPSITQHGGC